jgi:hypothetical protein
MESFDIQNAQGSWYGPVEMILPEPEARAISFPLVRTRTQGRQSVYPDIEPVNQRRSNNIMAKWTNNDLQNIHIKLKSE